ncbi:uncharacterized protein SPPG_06571 [Spizellomyces punctatus DAOM BR117]|uniref:Uncharacterized protein n=1 Tax=Spizellomyces punctatus (strain DAOM BR117) TaxID=645134 RepID=A0A0L0HB59_SPIPD|nr:uncharacterized protein SPPG_06571 [Spizellomyces punctatus DAOM BR117]KNC98166.1 hypothetical protein SPPG_06571 [Spizellomyces punctatus DAOM BR117]|eukprot:XP_016606206.1 hypothetical protein SPPG_06571 [Spizellomyces punctatus DAOM BR117]
MATRIPLIILGRKRAVGETIASFLSPTYHVVDIIHTLPDIPRSLQAASTRPKGFVIGGGFDDTSAKEAEQLAKAFDKAIQVVRVPQGYMQKVGPDGVATWIKQQLDGCNWKL